MKKSLNTTFSLAALMLASSQVAPAAVYSFRIDNAGTNLGSPTDDGQSFQQKWGSPENWTLISGVDDGGNDFPDGSDSVIIDRTGLVNNSTRLTTEGAPAGLNFISSITGTGTGNQDIVFKTRDFTINDLVSLASPNPFTIREERDRNLTISGVISGPGGLVLQRSGGFSDGVDTDELITITGTSPNTISGPIRLWNDSGVQPAYWVADKVGAFGQTPTLTLEGNTGATGVSSLHITSNTIGGGGAIDDFATQLMIGAQGLLHLDAGVNEVINGGNLLIDLSGTGTFTEVAPGTYNNSEPWLSGQGSVTVIPEPSSVALAALALLGLVRRKR